MTRLIDVDKLKVYIDDCECCEKCDTKRLICEQYCELPDCVTPQWERVLNEQPTVDAVPVSFIQQRIDYLQDVADYALESNGGYIESANSSLYELKLILSMWKKEQEKQNGIN